MKHKKSDKIFYEHNCIHNQILDSFIKLYSYIKKLSSNDTYCNNQISHG